MFNDICEEFNKEFVISTFKEFCEADTIKNTIKLNSIHFSVIYSYGMY